MLRWHDSNKHLILLINTDTLVSVLFLNYTLRCSHPALSSIWSWSPERAGTMEGGPRAAGGWHAHLQRDNQLGGIHTPKHCARRRVLETSMKGLKHSWVRHLHFAGGLDGSHRLMSTELPWASRTYSLQWLSQPSSLAPHLIHPHIPFFFLP